MGIPGKIRATLFIAKGYAACHQPVKHDDEADSGYAAFPFQVFMSRKSDSVRYSDWGRSTRRHPLHLRPPRA